MKPGPEERLAGVDVADAGNGGLVEKKGLERTVSLGDGEEGGCAEAGIDRFGSVGRGEACRLRGVDEGDAAEAAWIGVSQGAAVVEDEPQVLVRPGRIHLVEPFPGAGHAEVEDEAVAGVEFDEDGLGAAEKAEDLAADRPVHLSGRKAQRLVAAADGADAASAGPGFEAAADGFDFWEFRHESASGSGSLERFKLPLNFGLAICRGR
ncbi:MAG: hypothetical protein RL095_217 [Verrucomicrobiota bacterium]